MSHVETLTGRLRAGRGIVNVSVLRFATHDRLAAVFPDYLLSVYHSMRAAVQLMGVALDRSEALADRCPVAARLAPYWEEHIREETGHDAWLLADMRRIGVAEARIAEPPTAAVAELMGALHFWVVHTHPVALLAYFHLVEGTPPTTAFLDHLVRAGIPREGLECFYRHARIDIEHGRDIEQLIDALPLTARHLDLMVLCGATAQHRLASMMDELSEAADRLGPAAAVAR